MIVRILGEGQLEVSDSAAGELNELDSALEAAVERGDEPGFRAALEALHERVQAIGTPVDAAALEPSRLILPRAGASMAEVRKLMSDDGLISG
ncbi:MAG: PspA-associated protein PspAA [Streptosporangiaceae bacterium]